MLFLIFYSLKNAKEYHSFQKILIVFNIDQ